MVRKLTSPGSTSFLRASRRPVAAAFLGLSLGTYALGQNATTVDPAKAENAYLAGSRLLEKRDFAGAQSQFAEAARLNPRKKDYTLAFELTREYRVSELMQQVAKANLAGESRQANQLLAQARTLDPSSELVLAHTAAEESLAGQSPARAKIVPADSVLFSKPIEVQPDQVEKEFDLRGNSQQLIEQVARAYGIKVVFDNSVSSGEALPLMHFILDRSPYDVAMPALLKMTKMFGVPVAPRQLLVARDNQEDRARLERLSEETIFVPASTPEQLNELTNIIKNVFDVKQVSIAASSGTIAVRAPMSTLTALNETIRDLIDGDAEVVLDLKLVSVDKSRTVNTGTQTPTSAGAFSVSGEAQSIVNANPTLVQQLISSGAYVPNSSISAAQNQILEALILVLSGAVTDAKVAGLVALAGNGLTLTGLYLGSGATVNLSLNSSDVRALDDLSVRVGDRQTATLKVGEKYPITTATYSSGVSASTASALSGVSVNGVSASSLLNQYLGSAASIPQVQYEDIGITLKVTPAVLRSGLVNMKVDLKIEALTGDSLDNIPVLTSRVFTSDITLAEGTTAMMLSDLSKTESAAISGLPGLGELPGFQESAADDLRAVDTSELMLLVTPHVVRHRKDLTASRQIPFTTSVPQEY